MPLFERPDRGVVGPARGWARSFRLRLLALMVAVLLPASAHAQVLVQPRRAFKSPVREFQFDWRYLDVLASPRPKGPPASAGLRLYYYERERAIAELALPVIADLYDDLAARFAYAPSQRFPYVLYNTYQEFLETNLFAAQEGVLGVTSPQDLTLTLPYFGDHRRFREVSHHEMAHQFTIQKLRDLARRADTSSPIASMPLWFVEGLAEFYAQEGLDPETEMLARDLVVNPDLKSGYSLQGFFDDRPWSVLWTYKIGQARCAFLEETYGEGTIQRILDRSTRMETAPKGQDRVSFAGLLQLVTRDDPDTLQDRFVEWLKRRAYTEYLGASQRSLSLSRLARRFDGEVVTALSAAPDGSLLLYRTTQLETMQTQLVLVDPQRPGDDHTVVADGGPGADSLHPIATRNFQLGSKALVYVAEMGSRDTLYWREVSSPDHHIELGRQRRYDLGRTAGLVAIDSPAFSPDEGRVAFIGTDGRGFRDVYELTLTDGAVRRLTSDVWAERQLSWGKGGIVFTSDAVPSHRYNLFRLDPDGTEPPAQLTNEEHRDLSDPLVTRDGRVFFVTYDRARADVYELEGAAILQRSGVSTGLSDVAPGPGGALWALWLESGRRRPVMLKRDHMLAQAAGAADPVERPPEPLREELGASHAYEPMALENWQLGQIFGFAGAGGGGVFGQVMGTASDRMHDRALVLNLAIYGRLDLIDGMVLYVDQSSRIGKGVGAFESIEFRNDRSYTAQGLAFSSLDRFFGVTGLLRLPFSTYEYVEAEAALGGVSYFLMSGDRAVLAGIDDGAGGNLARDWEARNGGVRVQGQLSLRYGLDTLRYHPAVGPLGGSSVLVETSFTGQPQSRQTFGEVRLDAAHYFPIKGAFNIGGRLGVGTSYGGRLRQQFYLSSFDTLRGVPFGDPDWLLGERFAYGTVEARVPLTGVVRVVFLPAIVGVVGVDFGTVGDDWDALVDKRVLDAAVGLNFVFGPLVFRVHFAHRIPTGAHPQRAGLPALPSSWVTNLSLNWLYL